MKFENPLDLHRSIDNKNIYICEFLCIHIQRNSKETISFLSEFVWNSYYIEANT